MSDLPSIIFPKFFSTLTIDIFGFKFLSPSKLPVLIKHCPKLFGLDGSVLNKIQSAGIVSSSLTSKISPTRT